MRPAWSCHAFLVLLCLAAGARAQEQRFAALGDCPLEAGGVLADCRQGYLDFRSEAPADAPVLLFPTWFAGSAQDLVSSGYVGPGLLADTTRYRVIVADALGNGVSSSPSNSAGQGGADFPSISIGDMVTAQHRLLTEVLGVDRVHAVLGISMGGMQAFTWMARHPGFAARFVPIEGTPWQGPHDLLLWRAWEQVLAADDGSPASLQYTAQLIGRLSALFMWSPDYLARTVKPADLPAFEQGLTQAWDTGEVQDRLAQVRAMLALDLSAHAWPAPPPRALVVVSRRDMVVTPGPSLALARQLGLEPLVLDSDCGHLASTEGCAAAETVAAVHAFLAAP